jgi:hypothetical protein
MLTLGFTGITEDGEWDTTSGLYDLIEDAEAAAEEQFGRLEWLRLFDDNGDWIVSMAFLNRYEFGIHYECVTVMEAERKDHPPRTTTG